MLIIAFGCLILISLSRSQVPCGLQFENTVGLSPSYPSPSNQKGDRIVNGEQTLPDEFPWIVSLQRINWDSSGKVGWEHACGGSIISQSIMVTAAHCEELFHGSRETRVVAGCLDLRDSGDCQVIQIRDQDFIGHEKHRKKSDPHDIAIIKLSQSLNFTNEFNHAVGPVCLPSHLDMSFQGISTVAGYGKFLGGGVDNEYLSPTQQVVDLNILSSRDCKRTYLSKISYIPSFVKRPEYYAAGQVCAGFKKGNKDSCQGDSGGPLMVSTRNRIIMIGIVSFGPNNECAVEGMPGVYTKVSHYIDWIRDKVRLYSKDVIL